MQFDAFWRATGEQPFAAAVVGLAECYRLSVRTARGENHRTYRMQRPSLESDAGSEFVAHFVQFGVGGDASAWTHRILLESRHWSGLAALLGVAGFWELPERIERAGLDGATYTVEAHLAGRSHQVVRWSPAPVVSGGELLCVVTDYIERLGELAAYRCELHERYGQSRDAVPCAECEPSV